MTDIRFLDQAYVGSNKYRLLCTIKFTSNKDQIFNLQIYYSKVIIELLKYFNCWIVELFKTFRT